MQVAFLVVVKEEVKEFSGDKGLTQPDEVGVVHCPQDCQFSSEFVRLYEEEGTSIRWRGIFFRA